jgi:nitrogen-specific signal transduction histidine kinase
MCQAVEPRAAVVEAVRKARDLAGDAAGEVVLQIADYLPTIPADRAYLTRAIAVIVAHALRASAADANGRIVRVRAAMAAEPGTAVRISIEHGTRLVTQAELEALFARQASSRGRGLTLGLSLARAVVELHGGSVEVDSGPDRMPIAHCYLPLTSPKGTRLRLSSRPALG